MDLRDFFDFRASFSSSNLIETTDFSVHLLCLLEVSSIYLFDLFMFLLIFDRLVDMSCYYLAKMVPFFVDTNLLFNLDVLGVGLYVFTENKTVFFLLGSLKLLFDFFYSPFSLVNDFSNLFLILIAYS